MMDQITKKIFIKFCGGHLKEDDENQMKGTHRQIENKFLLQEPEWRRLFRRRRCKWKDST
jgi:hypothetical protein